MNITSNPFALLGNDEGLVAEPEVKNKRKNNNQKGGQGGNNTQQGGGQGGNNNNNANRPVELTAAQRKAKAEKIFKQRNSLSEDQKKQRNKTKKEKKVLKQNPKSPSTPQSKPSTPAAPGATTSTDSKSSTSTTTSTTTNQQQSATTTPAVPVKTADQLKKEHEEDRQQKISTFLSSVNSALPGSTIFFKLDLNQLQKDSKSVQDDLAAGLWKKSIDRIISTDLFLSKFLSALPPSLGHKTASEVIPVGRYHMKPIRRFDLALHLYSLLKGPSNHGIQHPKEQCLSLVSDFLDGLLDHKPKDSSSSKSKKGSSFDDADYDDAADDEHGKLGSEGNTRSAFNLGDYFANVKLPESKPKSSEASSSSSSSSSSSDGKGKEKVSEESSTTAAKQPEQETSFGRPSTAAGTGTGVQDKENPTTYLTEEDKNYLDEATLRSLVRKIPFDYKIGYVCSPLFNPSSSSATTVAKPDTNAKRDYSIKERGKEDGAGERERVRKEYEAGFMYTGNGLDHAYVMWKGSDMIWLLTTGLDKTGGKSGQTSGAKVAAVVREDEEKKKKEKEQQQQQQTSAGEQGVGGKPAWKTQRNF